MSVIRVDADRSTHWELVSPAHAGADAAALGAVDVAVLDGFAALQAEGEPDLIVELIDLYLEDAPRKVASMLEAAVALQMSRVAEFFATERSPGPCGSGMPYSVPDQAFGVRDGYLAVSARTQVEWERLCRLNPNRPVAIWSLDRQLSSHCRRP